MAPLVMLLNATKVLSVAGVIAVSVDSLFYRAFRKANLLPFESPLDEDQEELAKFAIDTDVDEGGFFFALATAPAHVEDKLNDAWLEFASADESKHAPLQGGSSDVGPDIRDEQAESSGISLNEEGQAAETFEGKEDSESARHAEDLSKGSSPDEPGRSASGKSLTSPAAPGDQNAGESGSGANTPTSGATMSEWEVVSDTSDKDRAEDGNGSSTRPGKGDELASSEVEELKKTASTLQLIPATSRRRQRQSTAAATLQFNPPRKIRQLGRVGVEAMLHGFDKVSEIIDEYGEESSNVVAWQNAFYPEERLRFWSDPDKELGLAKSCNTTVFRMGVDWSRIMPVEPVNGIEKAVNWEAVKRYRYIIERVHAHGMRVMLTLFHHSLPPWAAKYGGWKREKTADYFIDFTRLVVEKYADLVDFWITFNEPHVFAMMTYCAGAWPGGDPSLLETATSVLPKGAFRVAMSVMGKAHVQAYDIIHENGKKISKKPKVGVSHHISFMRPYGLPDVPLVMFSDWMTRFAFLDGVTKQMDYIGVNYYGQEVVSAPGLRQVENDEYSEAGRGVYPDGLYRMLLTFHERYKKFNIPFIITENGIADASDYIRRPYIVEHLLAIKAAMIKGVPVHGYCFWTTSDNWEWADGYGPKFGLFAVDRRNDLARSPRPSYYLYSEIAKTGVVTKKQRDQAWEDLQRVVAEGRKRPFCRAVDSNGLMYSGGLDIPMELPFVDRDWRFGHYEMEGLQDPLSRFIRFIFTGAFLGLKKKGREGKSSSPNQGPALQDRRVPDLKPELESEQAPAVA